MKPSLGMWRECHPTFQLTKHCDYRSRHHSVDNLTVIGSAALVAPTTAGSTNSARTISAHLLTYSEQPSSVVTLERRYGPRRLRDDDDMTYRHTSEAHRRKLLLGRWARAPTFLDHRARLSLSPHFLPNCFHTVH